MRRVKNIITKWVTWSRVVATSLHGNLQRLSFRHLFLGYAKTTVAESWEGPQTRSRLSIKTQALSFTLVALRGFVTCHRGKKRKGPGDELINAFFSPCSKRDYCCHPLICIVKTIVLSLHFTLTGLKNRGHFYQNLPNAALPLPTTRITEHSKFQCRK